MTALSRTAVFVGWFGALALVLTYCGGGQTAPAPTSAPSSSPAPNVDGSPASRSTVPSHSEPTHTPAFASTSVTAQGLPLAPTSPPSYLEQETPPCTPVPGSTIDPCEPYVAESPGMPW